MKFKKSLVFLLILLASFSTYAAHHQRDVSNCYPYILSVTEQRVLLSNGYRWQPDYTYFNAGHNTTESLEKVQQLWRPGDRVIFTYGGNSPEGYPWSVIYNYDLLMSRGLYATVHWDPIDHDRLCITRIKGEMVLLSDGSRWQVKEWNGGTKGRWKKGDLIIISPWYDDNWFDLTGQTHTLVNLTDNETNNAKIR